MVKKYVLHGGFRAGDKQINDEFFAEILKDVPDKAKVLIVYFATDNGDRYFPEDVEQLEKNSGGKKFVFEKANESNFEDQVKLSEVIYIHGGSSLKLLESLEKFPNFSDLIKGKVVAGDSAGANVLSTVFYSKRNGVCEGLGILPIKFVPHFEEESRDKLEKVYKDLRTVFLKEYQHEVVL